jgi:hypothetical protein
MKGAAGETSLRFNKAGPPVSTGSGIFKPLAASLENNGQNRSYDSTYAFI